MILGAPKAGPPGKNAGSKSTLAKAEANVETTITKVRTNANMRFASRDFFLINKNLLKNFLIKHD
jgi:hypothetical protein